MKADVKPDQRVGAGRASCAWPAWPDLGRDYGRQPVLLHSSSQDWPSIGGQNLWWETQGEVNPGEDTFVLPEVGPATAEPTVSSHHMLPYLASHEDEG